MHPYSTNIKFELDLPAARPLTGDELRTLNEASIACDGMGMAFRLAIVSSQRMDHEDAAEQLEAADQWLFKLCALRGFQSPMRKKDEPR